MKKILAILATAVYLTLAFAQSLTSWGTLVFGYFNTIAQVSLDIALVIILFKKDQNKTINSGFFSLLLAFLFMAVGDVIYGTVVNIFAVTNLRGSFIESLYNSIYFFSLLAISHYFISTKHLASQYLKTIAWSIFSFVLMLFLFIFGKHLFINELPVFTVLLHVACLVTKAVIISFGIMNAILFRASWRRIVASGFLIILTYSTLLEYLEVKNELQMGFPMEIFWTFGLATVLVGVLKAKPLAEYNSWEASLLSTRLTIYSFILSISVIGSWFGLQFLWGTYFQNLPKTGIMTSWCVFLLVCLGSYSYFLRSLLIDPMLELTTTLRSANENIENLKKQKIKGTYFTEFNELADEIVINFKALLEEKLRSERLSKLALHMSHDIRSPLTALRMLTGQTEGLPEDSRQMIIQIASRINLIAENLLSEHRQSKQGEPIRKSEKNCLIYSVIETIVSEKRILLPKSRIALDLSVSENAYNCWVMMDSEAAGRILSNLLNNSIEAFENNPRLTNPRVCLFVSQYSNQFLRMSIQDNAEGIPEQIEKSIQMGKSISTKNHGSGVGLSQARDTIESIAGRMEIFTQIGFGTVINILIPICEAPKWFAPHIEIDLEKPIIVVDDDYSIHAMWEKKLGNKIQIIDCTSIEEARKTLEKFPNGCTALVDFNFRGDQKTGLDLLKTLPSNVKAYLVTSHFEDEFILGSVESTGALVVPKLLAPFTKIIFKNQKKMRGQNGSVDLVLIDNDPLVRTTWEIQAQAKKLNCICVHRWEEISPTQINLDTPIFVDKDLGYADGLEIIQMLSEKGYRSLFIASGYNLDFDEMNRNGNLSGVIGKDFPEMFY